MCIYIYVYIYMYIYTHTPEEKRALDFCFCLQSFVMSLVKCVFAYDEGTKYPDLL